MSTNCPVCGCADFNLIDGFYYCATCSSQSQVQREIEMEDMNLIDNMAAVIQTRIRTRKAPGECKKPGKKAQYQPTEEHMEMYGAAVETEDYPRYLNRCGLRLATFTKLLSRYTNILIRDFDVPSSVRNHALCIFQRYLSHMKVAFCDEELSESNAYCPLVKNLEYEAQVKEKQKEIEQEKQRKLYSGTNILSQLTSNDIDENLVAQTTREEAVQKGDLQLVTRVETKLSTEAVQRLSKIPLSHEVLQVIIFLACQSSGATWILLSDITRWYREGRLPMSFTQRYALIPLIPGEDNTALKCNLVRVTTPIVCLFESMRFVVAMCQITNIPVQPISVDFDQIVCRYCFNLNLPSVFSERVRALSAQLSPNCELSEDSTKRFGLFDSSALIDYALSPAVYYIYLGFEGRYTRSRPGERNFYHSVLPTIEVKAIALILFALKLTFGLDDHREYRMIEMTEDTKGSNQNFDFPIWMHQLRMRMDVWRGRMLKNVLEKRTRLPATSRIEGEVPTVRWGKIEEGNELPKLSGRAHPTLDSHFKGCVPNYVVNEARDYAFYGTFADDIEPRPSGWLDKEALLAPLRYQATRNEDWYEHLLGEEQMGGVSQQAALVDRYNADVFFKSFKNNTMWYRENVNDEHMQGDVLKAEGRCRTHDERMRWRRMFPCSGNYLSYPRPLFAKHLVKWQKTNARIYEPIIYSKALELLMRTARVSFSESFSFLLETLSLTIGEEQNVIYAFMLMIEMMFINYKALKGLRKFIESREDLTTCAQYCWLDDPPDQAEVTLRRREEQVESYDYRYEIVDIGPFEQCANNQHGTFVLNTKGGEGAKKSRRKRRAKSGTYTGSDERLEMERTRSAKHKKVSISGLRQVSERRAAQRSKSRTRRTLAYEYKDAADFEQSSPDYQGTSKDTVDSLNEHGSDASSSYESSSEDSSVDAMDVSAEDLSARDIFGDSDSDGDDITGGFKQLIVDSAKRPGRASRTISQSIDESPKSRGVRGCRGRGKPKKIAKPVRVNYRSKQRYTQRRVNVDKLARRHPDRLEFEFETAFTLALLKYW